MSGYQTFEVQVVVSKKGSRYYSERWGEFVEKSTIHMYHVDARTHDQAFEKARKYGRPLSVRKPNMDKLCSGPPPLLQEKYGANSPYPDAISMDEFVWNKKKRVERLGNSDKDRQSIDSEEV